MTITSPSFEELVTLARNDPGAFRSIPREDCLASARTHAQARRESIRARHDAGESGGNVVRALSEMADTVLLGVYRFALANVPDRANVQSRVALCALGGYGRCELSPYSDLDVALIHDGGLTPAIENLNSYIVPFLWDLGFHVGYVIRSIAETQDLVNRDKEIFTSFSQARLLAGDTTVFARLKLCVRDLQAEGVAKRYIQEIVRERFEELPAEYGDLYALAPDIKRNAGGLRDYHGALWLLMTAYGTKTLDEIASVGLLSPETHLEVVEALDFVLRLRNELHFATGKSEDRLTFVNQHRVAQALEYTADERPNIARLMEDYYAAAGTIRGLLRRAARLWNYQPSLSPATDAHAHTADDVTLAGGELHAGFHDPQWFAQAPSRLMEVFWKSASLEAPLSYETEHRIQHNLWLVGDTFRSSDVARRLFIALCNHPVTAGATLRQMAHTDLLGQYIPEFAAIEGIIRYEDFHAYPVGEHTLRALEALSVLSRRSDAVSRCLRTALEHLSDPYILVLAILFHDLGKAKGEVHVRESTRLTRRIGCRMGLPADDVERIAFLVEHHMQMTHISQYRDIDDEEIVRSFAETMRTEQRLRALFLLSYADMSAVGPNVWNDWKGALLMKLYLKAEKHLLGRTVSPDEAFWNTRKARRVRELARADLQDKAEAHIQAMGERYYAAFSSEQIAHHLELAARARESGFALHTEPIDGTLMTEITVSTRDQLGLFAKLAGSFTSQLMDVNSAALFTRPDGYVIDCFTVGEPSGGRRLTQTELAGLERVLRAVLAEGADVKPYVEQARRRLFALLQPKVPVRTCIEFDNDSSRTHTVIDIESGDRTGLLYDMAQALTGLGCDIASARIVTDARRVRDSFYVSCDGRKLASGEEMERIRMRLHNAIHRPSAVETKGAAT